MATASAAYEWSDTEAIHVEVSADDERPDVLDELARRAAWLLSESIAAVNMQAKVQP